MFMKGVFKGAWLSVIFKTTVFQKTEFYQSLKAHSFDETIKVIVQSMKGQEVDREMCGAQSL